MCIAICYLPPNESSRPNEQEMFFENLLRQVYCNQTIGNIVICGDFNSRCGYYSDFIEGVDEISPRSVIDVNENYNGDLFINFLTDIKTYNNNCGKSRYKPYWNDILQNQWNKVCSLEKMWLKSTGSNSQKKTHKESYCSQRKSFDRLNRKYKRKYLIEKQNSLEEKLMASNQKDLWKSIGKLGISIERNQSIPWSVIDNEGTVQTDKNVVLGQ